MEYILETKNLTKKYGQKEAAKDINLHVEEGQIYGLIGRNGAGKTTIMRMISGLSHPTSGSYSLFGKTGKEMNRLLKDVGVLIESPGLYTNLSAYENLKIKCKAMGVRSKGYVEELLKTVGLEKTDKRKPCGSYSLGMRQRLGIALALVGDPKMIVLDEPINGLDPQGIAEVRSTLSSLKTEKGITIMISSHILDELSKVADCYGIINEGQLIEEFTSEDLENRTGQYVVIRSGDDEGVLQALQGIGIHDARIAEGGGIRVSEQLDNTAEMAWAIVNARIPLYELFIQNNSLEDYYLRLTGGSHNG